MKDILDIVFRLTVSCLLAATVMGFTFIFTDKAKKHNEHVREEQVRFSLLGFTDENPAPETMSMHEVFRYIVTEPESQSIGYLVPMEDEGYSFVRIDLDGNLVDTSPIALDEDKVRETADRDLAITSALGPGKTIRYADSTIVVTEEGQRLAYLLGGKFPGFKTFIAVMLALDPKFSILGLEVLEHEEDPGLGGEIEQEYFKNQFNGKPFEVLKGLDVVKEPLPDTYLKALEYDVSEDDLARIMEEYRGNDIYALTGATISTKAVTDGVKGIVKKFAYRVSILDEVLQQQQIAVAF